MCADLSEFATRGEKQVRSSVEVGVDGGEFQTGELRAPIELRSDWDDVLKGFGLDPAEFYVVDDTVRMSKWQQSKRTESGDRDVVWLYSYKARFARRSPTLTEPDLAEIQAKIDKWRSRPSRPLSSDSEPCTFLINWADWQIGKSENGGVAATVDRIQASFDACKVRIKELRKAGRNIEKVAIFNMGDPSEGCDNNYASQRFTVQLNLRAQLNLVLDLWTQGVAALDPDLFASVLCNHGEWTRNGTGSSTTSDSDNVGGYLGDTLQRIFDETGPSEWHIAHDEMVQMVELSGVPVAFTHGHKISGKEIEWLRGQSQKLQYERGEMPRLWITAHRHHLSVEDYGPFFRFQCPSLDGGSKWFTDASGKWSTPGTLTLLVGNHDPKGWSDLAVL
jgi:hypothetical protein